MIVTSSKLDALEEEKQIIPRSPVMDLANITHS